MRLASTTTRLRHASLAWFPAVTLDMLPKEQEDVERRAVWLSARRGEYVRHPLLPLLPVRPRLACVCRLLPC